MGNPFPAITETAQLRNLTEAGIARLRKLNERDEHELGELRAERARLSAEVASIDEEMTDLHEAIGRRQAKMRGDVISQMPLVGPDAVVHATRFGGPDVIEPTLVQPRGSFPETQPDGYCVHCGEPVWRTSITPASPKGARHSYGATCNPDDPASKVAELDEQRTAVES